MRAIIDVEELRRFISALEYTRVMMREKRDFINREFKELNEVWQDANYLKFERAFGVTIAEIDQFLKYAELYGDYLRRKAQKAQDYLDGY